MWCDDYPEGTTEADVEELWEWEWDEDDEPTDEYDD